MTTTRHHQPWLHELQVCTHGNTTALSARGGFADTSVDGGSPSAEGLFVDDRRVLSRLSTTLHDADGAVCPATPMAASSAAGSAHFVAAVRDLGDVGPDPTVELHHRRTLGPARLTEVVTVASRAAAAVSGTLALRLAGDGAEIATVKSGSPGPAALGARATGPSSVVWEDERHRTTATFDPAPRRLDAGESADSGDSGDAARDSTPVEAEWDLDLALGGRLDVTVTVTVERLAPSAFDADAGVDHVGWDRFSVTSQDPRLARAVGTGVDDLRSLLLLDPESDGDAFAAAGSPWYLTLFGRDSIWAARMALPLGTDLALGTLRTLARRQGTGTDLDTAEAPGKIPHEVRRSTYLDPVSGMALPAVYYGTVDATSLWVCLLHDAWRWGLPEDDVRALLPHLRRAVDWLLHHASPDDTGLLRYVDASGHGLANQGWKDSGDSMRTASGSVANAPIALLEAQAYAVEAARAAATLFDVLGEPGADDVRAWGGALADRVRERFWMATPDGPALAMALDGDGGLVDGVGSNMGHVLGTGTLTAPEAATVAQTLVTRLLGPLGVATLSSDNPAYNPIGYHTGSIWTHDTAICAWGLSREGHAEAAARVCSALVEAAELFDYRPPELYAGETALGRPVPYPASCRPQAWSAASGVAVLTSLLGLRADVPAGELHLAPAASPFGAFRVDGLRLGDRTFAVAVAADGTVSVEGELDGVDVVVTPR